MITLIASAVLSQPAALPKTLVPFPHPLITEVLYNVPPGAEGDADGDGVRSATGDEFVELYNPHDRPIALKGYVITDGKNIKSPSGKGPASKSPETPATPGSPARKETQPPTPEQLPPDESRVRYVLPDITLQPGQIAVIFNGYTGGASPGGTPKEKPKDAPPKPGEAPKPVRLSMDVTSQYVAFGNGGDCVLLSDPDGAPVQCVLWGEQPKPPDDFAPLIERAPDGKFRGSVTRVGLNRGLKAHREQAGDLKGLPFSPGVFDVKPK